MLAETAVYQSLIIQGVSELSDTILCVCFVHTAHKISWPLDAYCFSRCAFGVEGEG